jgi:hypothetical protein
VTGNDHTNAPDGDAITGALRSPALPFEQVHEAAVLAEMADALTTAPEPSSVRRHRQVVAFAAVTVASLGVGGIIAAGPGGFRPFVNDDKPPASTIFDHSEPAPAPDGLDDVNDDDDVNHDDDDDVNDDDVNDDVLNDDDVNHDDENDDNGGGTERITTDPNFDCVDDARNHGQTVSSAAQAPGSNRAAAQSECGMPVGSGGNRNQSGGEVVDRVTPRNNGNGNDGIPGPPASTPGNPNPGPPASTPDNGNGNDGIPGPPASTPANPDPGPPVSTPDDDGDATSGAPTGTPANSDPGPPASTPNGNGNGNGNRNTTTTQPAG